MPDFPFSKDEKTDLKKFRDPFKSQKYKGQKILTTITGQSIHSPLCHRVRKPKLKLPGHLALSLTTNQAVVIIQAYEHYPRVAVIQKSVRSLKAF